MRILNSTRCCKSSKRFYTFHATGAIPGGRIRSDKSENLPGRISVKLSWFKVFTTNGCMRLFRIRIIVPAANGSGECVYILYTKNSPTRISRKFSRDPFIKFLQESFVYHALHKGLFRKVYTGKPAIDKLNELRHRIMKQIQTDR